MTRFTSKSIVRKAALTLAATTLLASGASMAREPFTAAELADQKAKHLVVIKKGYDLWHGSKPSMSTNGLGCGNCHPDATASNPQTYPKFQTVFNKVVPYREMVNWCIQNPQAGKALDVGGEDMYAMEAYAFYLHRGLPIEPGLASRQTSAIVVRDNYGFETKGSGIGFDK